MANQVHFPDAAHSTRKMASLLQDQRRRDDAMTDVEGAPWPLAIAARAVGNLEVGLLIQDLGDDSVRTADASVGRPASGVVVRMMLGGRVLWAPLARVRIKIPLASASPQLWLGQFGSVLTAEPSAAVLAAGWTGWISQTVARVIGGRDANGYARCLVQPGVPQFLG
jgi:hypothetical protein